MGIGNNNSRIMFIHLPKTGGTSIKMTNTIKNLYYIGHNDRYGKYKFLKDYDKNLLNECFKFCFVRNPYDRLVSTFFYLQISKYEEDKKDAEKFINKYEDFKSFVLNQLTKSETFEQIHLRPLYTWICDDNYNLIPNFIGKVENYNNDIRTINKITGLNIPIKHINKSEHKHYSEYYDDEIKEIVYNIYKKDFELFGYKKELF